MKTKCITLIGLFLCLIGNAQAPEWLWAKNVGIANSIVTVSNDITTDTNGNIFVMGIFYNGSITFGNTILTNKGLYDIFIAKYDATGKLIWAKGVGGIGKENGTRITTDTSGNVYITGNFDSPILTIGETILTNVDGYDIFIAKFDSEGNTVWAKSIIDGYSRDDIAYGITPDTNGNVFIIGDFVSSTIKVGTTILTNKGGWDFFIAKFDNQGNKLWAKSFGNSNHDYGVDIGTDTSGNIFITGYFASPSINFGNSTLSNLFPGKYDIYIAKYDTFGNSLWAKSGTGNSDDASLAIATDVSGSVFISGGFKSPTLTIGNTTLSNPFPDNDDIFIAKYDAFGNSLWAKSANGNSGDISWGLTTDSNGNVLAIGYSGSSTLTFDNTTLSNINSGEVNLFITKYDTTGNLQWAKNVEKGTVAGIVTDADGNALITGNYYQSITFGGTTLMNENGANVFIAKLSSSSLGIDESFKNEKSILIYHNPASNSTTISFSLFQSQNISLKIFDLNGRLVATLANKLFEMGESKIDWNTEGVSSGIYLLQFQTAENVQTKKFIVMK